MKDDPILQAWLLQVWRDATNCWLAGAGLPPLKNPPQPEQPEILNGRDEDYPDADEDEPDRYENEDERLDSPIHGQARGQAEEFKTAYVSRQLALREAASKKGRRT